MSIISELGVRRILNKKLYFLFLFFSFLLNIDLIAQWINSRSLVFGVPGSAYAQSIPAPRVKKVFDQSGPRPPINRSANVIEDRQQAVRFLNMATFGASIEDIDGLVGRDAADWLAEEFSKPPTKFTDRVLASRRDDGSFPDFGIVHDLLWQAIMSSEDQLRMRMTFALSQIFVASQETSPIRLIENAAYTDVLVDNAFTNYRTLLEEVTYSPLMARWLTYLRNRKGDPETGRMPDENYAREVMQLFSIGLLTLYRDGNPVLDNEGNPIETYDNDDIIGLSRVFTGLAYNVDRFARQPDDQAETERLRMFEEEHSPLEKSFLNVLIPPNTSGVESINIALDAIANHDNVAPFISRLLIQRFTASNPSAAYISRVATAFELGRYVTANGRVFGDGTRGDMKATLAAILLDRTVFMAPGEQSSTMGKVREPILKFTQWVRAFNVSGIYPQFDFRLGDTRPSDRLGQQMLRAPSVFNFYRPGYVAPQTLTGGQGLTAPELQILNSSTATGYLNFMTDFILDLTFATTDTGEEIFTPDYSTELALSDDPEALVAHLDLLLTGERLSPSTRQEIIAILEGTPFRQDDQLADDQLRRVEIAIALIIGTPAYHVIQ